MAKQWESAIKAYGNPPIFPAGVAKVSNPWNAEDGMAATQGEGTIHPGALALTIHADCCAAEVLADSEDPAQVLFIIHNSPSLAG